MSFKTFYSPLYCGEPADKNGYHSNRNKKLNYKIVYRYTLEGEFIGEMKFSKFLCEQNNLSYNSIRMAMTPTWSNKKRTMSSMNNIWILKEDFSQEELDRKVQEKKMDSNKNPKANKRSRRIIQRDADTKEIVRIWDSANQAGREDITGYRLTSIYRVLSGSRKTYACCTWEYEQPL